MALSRQDTAMLLAGALIVAAGVGLAFLGETPGPSRPPADPSPPALDTERLPSEAPGAPALLRFTGDLDLGGLPGEAGQPRPFVVGEVLTLAVDARDAPELRWTCNGKELLEDGRAWSAAREREFAVDAPGAYHFTVQGRNGEALTRKLERRVEVLGAKIESFDSDITSVATSNRYLTGETCSLLVEMVEPIRETRYLFRYSVNGKPIPHPDDEQEWTEADDLVYTFEKPGEYHFKVYVRRAEVETAEDSASLSMPIRVGDAVIYDVDASPEHGVIGQEVVLDATVWNLEGPMECRFGVLDTKQPGAGIQWLKAPDGREWGASQRTWLPGAAGVFRIRVEVRDGKGAEADDFWESHYTVAEAKDDF
jgi:hypothetical protein